jgi:hypothetical protein
MPSDKSTVKSVLAFFGLFVQFLPLSLFASYAFAQGNPTPSRWLEAFALGSGLSTLRLGFSYWRRTLVNPVVLGTDLYLYFGLVTCLTQHPWLVTVLSASQAMGFLVAVFIAGVVATKISVRGFVFAESSNHKAVLRASLALLAITSVAIGIAFIFRGDTFYSGVLPILSIALSQRVLRRQIETGHSRDDQSR